MRQSKQYRSPYAAMFWSVVLPGFGQFYNRDYLIAFVLIGLEFLSNVYSHLNLSLLNTFRGDLVAAHQVINYEWGLFYPSIYGFALWQAFNTAIANNAKLEGKEDLHRTYLSGFFIGMVVGMDFGLFWHDGHFITSHAAVRVFDFPVINGVIVGLLFGIVGHILEKTVYRKNKQAITPP